VDVEDEVDVARPGPHLGLRLLLLLLNVLTHIVQCLINGRHRATHRRAHLATHRRGLPVRCGSGCDCERNVQMLFVSSAGGG